MVTTANVFCGSNRFAVSCPLLFSRAGETAPQRLFCSGLNPVLPANFARFKRAKLPFDSMDL
jgi:hypothetical protein